MNHKISTYVILICILLVIPIFVSSYLTSEEIDEGICDKDNHTLFRWEGNWQCANLMDANVFNFTINNVTNIFNNYSLYSNQSFYGVDGWVGLGNAQVLNTLSTSNFGVSDFAIFSNRTRFDSFVEHYDPIWVEGNLTLVNGGGSLGKIEAQSNITSGDRICDSTGCIGDLGDYIAVENINISTNFCFDTGESMECVDNRREILNRDSVGPFLYNSSWQNFFNDSLLNDTIDGRAGGADTNLSAGGVVYGYLGLNGTENPLAPLYFNNELTSSFAIAQFGANITTSIRAPLWFDVYVDSDLASTSALGALIVKGTANTQSDYLNSNQNIDGIRYEIYKDSVAQTTDHSRNIKGIHLDFGFPPFDFPGKGGIHNGTLDIMGLEIDMPSAFQWIGGQGVYESYGLHIDMQNPTNLGTSDEWYNYGIFIDDGQSSAGVTGYSIWVDDNSPAYFDTDINATGHIKAGEYLSGDGSQGITDASSYWFCSASDCSTTCQVDIKDGLIVGCT